MKPSGLTFAFLVVFMMAIMYNSVQVTADADADAEAEALANALAEAGILDWGKKVMDWIKDKMGK
uniref:U-poneritoxin(01)-Om1a n=1 Tax=Odontomachus monticola TaxID=613454 RepID=TX11A_ODOMO|nr:RecName: Full=U-poneritoxin(01)-Om1a; Short=U-PONTX(01)-Om1a; AltName: Full=Pilosulin-like peptide 1; Short=PLP1; AltName: Full=Poneratoxin; Flags: Precursor [Odontomachus monticola]BBF98060.1 pilosulin-like peptide 1 [Odontomachus monticola]